MPIPCCGGGVMEILDNGDPWMDMVELDIHEIYFFSKFLFFIILYFVF